MIFFLYATEITDEGPTQKRHQNNIVIIFDLTCSGQLKVD